MTLSIDVTSSGLDAGPDYVTNTGQPPPAVTVVDDGGRFGFDISDATSVAMPTSALTDSYFGSNAFSVSLSLKAQDGALSNGQIFRIHSNLHVSVAGNGSVRADFLNDTGQRFTLTTQPSDVMDGGWHDLAISYDGSQGTFDLSLDGALAATGAASGNTKSAGSFGLNFGKIFSLNGFDGLIDDFQIDDVAVAPPPPPPPPGAYDTLTLDVTATGLDGGPDYQTEVGQPPPPVVSTQEDGRWGFDLDDGTQVAIPKQALDGPYFESDAFTVALSLKAQDGALSAGEILRIHSNLELKVSGDGSFRLDFINDQGARTTLNSTATNALDGEWHDVTVTYDDTAGTLALYLDDFEIVSGAASGSTKAMQYWGLNFGSAWGSTAFDGLIDDVTVTNTANPPAPPPPPPPTPMTEVFIDFSNGVPSGLTLFGDAFVSPGETLDLDGAGDYGLLAGIPEWNNATHVTASVDFRFDDPGDLDYARPIYNDGAFGFDVKGNALNAMVMTDSGVQRIYVGNQQFSDLQWHTVGMDLDTETDQLIITVDGQTVVDRSELDLVLPTSIGATQVGGVGWGRWLPGEIDNVSISIGTPSALADATGNPNPAVSFNTGGYTKWNQYATAPFIDRMKGAHEWGGEFARYLHSSGSAHAFRDTDVFSGTGTVANLSFTPQTILSIDPIISLARFAEGLINQSEYIAILSNPDNFFQIQTGTGGNSELVGRLRASDPFELMATFDSDIGTTLGQLRAGGQAIVTSGDRAATFDDLQLDANGWPIHPPLDVAGGEGEASTIVMWYPAEAANAPDSIYSGNFFLMADGEGTLELFQGGGGALNMGNIQIDGPTVVPFSYTPNGGLVRLTIASSDPNDVGEYVRNIRIVHEDHMDLFEAGEIFTPEFVEFHQDDRVLRWMEALETNENPPHAEGDFDDGPDLDYYTFNLGTTHTEANGFSIDAIVAFSNKTGVDPWINVPVNASDAYVQGMAEYIEANLDPKLKVHIELGNENWNSGFDTYTHAQAEGLARWGELQLQTDGSGQFVLDGSGDPIVLQDGYFFSPDAAAANGYTLASLAADLGLGHGIYDEGFAWAQWQSMRATQVAEIVDAAFIAGDAQTADARVEHVLGSQAGGSGNTPVLMAAPVWAEAEPGAWTDPAGFFETLAVNAYFGGTTGWKDSDIVDHWLGTMTAQEAQDMLLRHLKAGLDPSYNHIAFDGGLIDGSGNVVTSQVVTGVSYTSNLIVDVFDAIYETNIGVRQDILSGHGVATSNEVLFGADVHNYVRLVTETSGNTALQLRVDPAGGQFETVLEYDSLLSKTIGEMIDEGTLFVRSPESLADAMDDRIVPQKAYADTYGLDLAAYEGGQHFVAATWGPYSSNASNTALHDLFSDLNQTTEIGDLYGYWFDAWQALGGGQFAHFSDYGGSSQFGSWGTVEYLGQQNEAGASTPKYDAVQALNNAAPWWTTDARDPGAFLQGIVDLGTSADDTLVGSVEEDLLFGGDGNDSLTSGPGDDSLSGGAGTNIVDAGEGNDLILLTSLSDTIDGGDGFDTVKTAGGLSAVDLSTLNASNVEALDLRDVAHTDLTLSANDLFAFNANRSLMVYAETDDTLLLTGLTYQGSTTDGAASIHTYEATVSAELVTLTVWSDNHLQPDVQLFP